MAKTKPKVGDIVQIVFWDHAESSNDVLLFEVIGRIFNITPKSYGIKSWGYVTDVDKARDSNEENETRFAIVKRAIDTLRVLK